MNEWLYACCAAGIFCVVTGYWRKWVANGPCDVVFNAKIKLLYYAYIAASYWGIYRRAFISCPFLRMPLQFRTANVVCFFLYPSRCVASYWLTTPSTLAIATLPK